MKSGEKSLARTTLLRESFSFFFSCFERFAIREKRGKREWRGESEHVGYAWMETLLHGGCASLGPPYLDF